MAPPQKKSFVKDTLNKAKDSVEKSLKDKAKETAVGFINKLHLPSFKNGGRIKKTGTVKVHKGEYILPVGVPPTAKQRKMVMKKKL